MGGFITDFQYNWRKHKVPPKQVAEADPLQFMFLEAAEQALADAGYDRKAARPRALRRDGRDRIRRRILRPAGNGPAPARDDTRARPSCCAQQGRAGREDRSKSTRSSPTPWSANGRRWSTKPAASPPARLASRISKTLDLAGGAVAIDSGSTSALSGLSICVDMLLSGDNDVMICAAGQRRMGLNAFTRLQDAGLLASGQPHSVLDAGYDGVVPAEGVGVVILKRLADARRDGDRIHAILRGIGVAHHASHAEALRLAVERSSAMAGIAPTEVSVEELETDERLDAVGRGTGNLGRLARLGPAASTAGPGFGHGPIRPPGRSLGNGRLDQGQPGNRTWRNGSHRRAAQPAAVLDAWQHAVAAIPGRTKLTGRRLVGISCWSRGLACHLILEHGAAVASQPAAAKPSPRWPSAPPARHAARGRSCREWQRSSRADASRLPATLGRCTPSPAHWLTRAASQAPACNHAASDRADRVARVRPASPRDRRLLRSVAEWQICRLAGGTTGEVLGGHRPGAGRARGGLAGGRSWLRAGRQIPFGGRGRQRDDRCADKLRLARPQLDNLAARNVLEQQGIFHRQMPSVRPQVAFVFPGQGSQYSGMLRPLVESVPAAARLLGEIDAVMGRLGHPKFAELAWSAGDRLGQDVWTTQVSMLLADALVLAALADRGIRPDLVLGHSYGEFVALYAAGAWDFATAVRMTQARCAGIEAAVAGGETGMLATDATPELIEQLSSSLGLDLYVANLNAPDQCVVGGTRTHLGQLASALTGQGRQAKMLAVPGAFHTPLLSTASRPLEEALRRPRSPQPQVKFVSTVNNSVIGDPAEIRRNLARQLTTPVRYAQLIGRLAAESPTVFVEVGPQQTLTRLNRRILGSARRRHRQRQSQAIRPGSRCWACRPCWNVWGLAQRVLSKTAPQDCSRR